MGLLVGVIWFGLVCFVASIYGEFVQTNEYIYSGTFFNEYQLSCWIPIVKGCDDCHALGSVCDASPFPPQTYTTVWKGSSSVVLPLGYSHVWDNSKNESTTSRASLWVPVCPDGYTAFGDVAMSGLLAPSINLMRCISDEYELPKSYGGLLFRDYNSATNKMLSVIQLNNSSFFVAQNSDMLMESGCRVVIDTPKISDKASQFTTVSDCSGSGKLTCDQCFCLDGRTGQNCERRKVAARCTANTVNATPIHPTQCGGTGSVSVNSNGPSSNVIFMLDGDPDTRTQNISASLGYIFLNVPAGNHYVSVIDGCDTVSKSFTIIKKTIEVPVNITYPVKCNNDRYTVALNVSGFQGQINSSINGGQTWTMSTSYNIPANLSGIFTVLVRNSSICTGTGYWTIINPPAITSQVSIYQPTCNGYKDGYYNVTSLGGGADSNSLIASVTGQEDKSNATSVYLGSGNYTYNVTDGTCVKSFTATIIDPPVVTTVMAYTNESCYGKNDGTVSISVVGAAFGELSLNFNKQGWAATLFFNSLAPGTYTYIARNSAGCISPVYNVTIRPASRLVSQISITNETCYGYKDGTITFSGQYSYSINSGAFTTKDIFTGLGAGNYNYTIKDGNSCTASYNFSISGRNMILGVIGTVTAPQCWGNMGSFNLFSVSGGYGAPFYISLDNKTYVPYQSQLAAVGPTDFYIRDSKGCLAVQNIVVPSVTAISIAVSATTIPCYGGYSNVSIVGTGGVGSKNLSIDGSPVVSGQPYKLYAGSHTISAQDSNMCIKTSTLVISQYPQIPMPTVNVLSTVPTSGGKLVFTGGPFIPAFINSTISYSLLIDGSSRATASNNPTMNTTIGEGTGVHTYSISVRNTSTGCTNESVGTWSYTAPSVNLVSPVQTVAASYVYIQGSNFGSNTTVPNVTLAGLTCTSCRVVTSHTSINCSCPARLEGPAMLRITVGGQSTNYGVDIWDVPTIKDITVTAQARTATVKWIGDVYAESFNLEATGPSYLFTVTSDPAKGRSFVLQALLPRTKYAVRLKETNKFAMCNFTQYVNFTTLADVPDAPVLTVTYVNTTSLNISWPVPGNAGTLKSYSLTIQRFSVEEKTVNLTATTNSYIAVVTPGERYVFFMMATNQNGDSLYSDGIIYTMPVACGNNKCEAFMGEDCATCIEDCGICAMRAPRFVDLYYANNSYNTIMVQWTGYATLDKPYFYILQSNFSGSFQTIYNGTRTFYTLTNLSMATTYFFTISAAYGNIANTSSLIIGPPVMNFTTTSGLPSSPQIKLVQHGRDYLTVSWDASNDNGSAIVNYILSFSNDSDTSGNWQTTNISAAGSRRIVYSGLQLNTAYYFKAQTFNLVGQSAEVSVSFSTDSPSCGDLVCDSGENCTNCIFDCPACSYPKCPGTPECNGHGDCLKGVCQCTGSWSGPQCNIDGTVPIVIGGGGSSGTTGNGGSTTGTPGGGNDNSSTVIITPTLPDTKPDKVSFNIALKTIREIDSNDKLVEGYTLADYYADKSTDHITFGDTPALRITYNTTFPNKASITVTLYAFAHATSYPFAGTNVTVPENSVKYSISISGWNFKNTRDRLQLILQTDGTSTKTGSCKTTESSNDNAQNLQWFKLNVDGVSLYAQFLADALFDNKTGKVLFELTESSDVSLTIPSFWDTADIDPVYSVLLDSTVDTSGCIREKDSSKSLPLPLIAGVAGGVGGAAVLTAASVYGYHLIKKKKRFSVKSHEMNHM